MTCAACSNSSDKVALAPPPVYLGIPAGLMERCTVHDVPQETVASIIESRSIYIKAFNLCTAKVDAIRKFDAEARSNASTRPAN
ncbi:Rz1-like lysis system protein LysC [Novosphingobium clariflavum]|uniref:Uncharacterized protein n=1 Tax=Novosphingobium clariflavum TaxID=2029884 RepID=A0ABV6S968_9SPHN|nr:hypothetical protein [Novosphingobium clariflavum]